MYCKNCGNEIKEGTAFCPNCGESINKNKKSSKLKKYKIPIIIIIVCIIIMCLVITIKLINNKNDGSANNLQQSEISQQEKVYITQNSSTSPTGKEFIGTFSNTIVELYEKNSSENNKSEYYENSIKGVKTYSYSALIDNVTTGQKESVLDTKIYYNSNNNNIIAFADTMNMLDYTQYGLQENETNYQEFLENFIKSSMNLSMNFHNMSEEERNSTEVKEMFTKYQKYVGDNVDIGNKIVAFDNYSCSYNILGSDILFVYTNFNDNNNKKEALILAYDENTNVEDIIKKWYSNVYMINGNEKYIESPVATIKVKDYGTMQIELYYNEAPNTVKNFIALSNNGFYDNLTFHRVEKDFVIQGGDRNGDGTGHATLGAINKETTQDKEYSIEGEFKSNGIDNNIQFEKGVIAMARSDYSSLGFTKEGYNSASSQFFIMTKDNFSLNGEHAAFGKVIEGIDVLDKLNNVEVLAESDKPINPPIIESIRVNTKNKKYDLPETMDVFFETGDNRWLSNDEYLEIAYQELINRKLILKNSYGYKQTLSKEIIDIEKHEENNFLILNMKVTDTLYSTKGSVSLEMRFIVAIWKDGTISEIRQVQ